MNKTSLILIISSQQDQVDHISKQLNPLTEQIALMNQRSFGRKTESASQLPHQMSLFGDLYPDEISDPNTPKEPEITEIVVSSYTHKEKTKREEKP
jgi:hypothetical protein